MTSRSKTTTAIIRLRQSIHISWGIALGIGLTLSLNAFVLIGWLTTYARAQTAAAILLSFLIFLPIILTYTDYAVTSRYTDTNGIFSLLQSKQSAFTAFVGGWLMLIGYISLLGGLAYT